MLLLSKLNIYKINNKNKLLDEYSRYKKENRLC